MKFKYLSHEFRGELYDKREPLRKNICDRCYVFDLAEGGRLVGMRSVMAKNPECTFITDLMELDEIRETVEYFKTFPSKPAIVSTRYGLAFVLQWLFPSNTYFVVSYPNCGADKCYRSLLYHGHALHESSTVKALRMRRREQSDNVEFITEQLFREFDECFGTVLSEPTLHGGDVPRRLEQRIYALSYYIGCGANIACNDDIICAGEVDVALFEGFIMSLMMCARRITKHREITIDIRKQSRGILISSYIIADSADAKTPELDMFYRLALRKRLRFEHTHEDNVHHLYFEPMRIDWGLLGYKQPEIELK